MDFVEPWVIRSGLVVALLGAVNVWLFRLSMRQTPEEPATSRAPRRERT